MSSYLIIAQPRQTAVPVVHFILIISVMSVKIKSILARHPDPIPADHSQAISPSRCEVSRLSSGSALKNLSHERYMKKLSKLKDSAEHCQSGSRGIMESLTNLEEQYENMRNQKTTRSSLKKSIQIKGVPHTCITLNPRTSLMRSGELNRQNSANTTFHSRKSSLAHNQNSLRVVTIGTEYQKKKKPNKKKGIYISLLESKNRSIKLF